MKVVNTHEARTHLSKLVARAAAGETIVVAKAGNPQARLVPMEHAAKRKKRELGWLKGQITVPDDWKAFGREEIEEMFYGNPGKFR